MLKYLDFSLIKTKKLFKKCWKIREDFFYRSGIFYMEQKHYALSEKAGSREKPLEVLKKDAFEKLLHETTDLTQNLSKLLGLAFSNNETERTLSKDFSNKFLELNAVLLSPNFKKINNDITLSTANNNLNIVSVLLVELLNNTEKFGKNISRLKILMNLKKINNETEDVLNRMRVFDDSLTIIEDNYGQSLDIDKTQLLNKFLANNDLDSAKKSLELFNNLSFFDTLEPDDKNFFLNEDKNSKYLLEMMFSSFVSGDFEAQEHYLSNLKNHIFFYNFISSESDYSSENSNEIKTLIQKHNLNEEDLRFFYKLSLYFFSYEEGYTLVNKIEVKFLDLLKILDLEKDEQIHEISSNLFEKNISCLSKFFKFDLSALNLQAFHLDLPVESIYLSNDYLDVFNLNNYSIKKFDEILQNFEQELESNSVFKNYLLNNDYLENTIIDSLILSSKSGDFTVINSVLSSLIDFSNDFSVSYENMKNDFPNLDEKSFSILIIYFEENLNVSFDDFLHLYEIAYSKNSSLFDISMSSEEVVVFLKRILIKDEIENFDLNESLALLNQFYSEKEHSLRNSLNAKKEKIDQLISIRTELMKDTNKNKEALRENEKSLQEESYEYSKISFEIKEVLPVSRKLSELYINKNKKSFELNKGIVEEIFSFNKSEQFYTFINKNDLNIFNEVLNLERTEWRFLISMNTVGRNSFSISEDNDTEFLRQSWSRILDLGNVEKSNIDAVNNDMDSKFTRLEEIETQFLEEINSDFYKNLLTDINKFKSVQDVPIEIRQDVILNLKRYQNLLKSSFSANKEALSLVFSKELLFRGNIQDEILENNTVLIDKFSKRMDFLTEEILFLDGFLLEKDSYYEIDESPLEGINEEMVSKIFTKQIEQVSFHSNYITSLQKTISKKFNEISPFQDDLKELVRRNYPECVVSPMRNMADSMERFRMNILEQKQYFENLLNDENNIAEKLGLRPEFNEVIRKQIVTIIKNIDVYLTHPESPANLEKIKDLRDGAKNIETEFQKQIDQKVQTGIEYTLIVVSVVGGIGAAGLATKLFSTTRLAYSSSLLAKGVVFAGTTASMSAGGVLAQNLGLSAFNAVGIVNMDYEEIWDPKAMGENFLFGWGVSSGLILGGTVLGKVASKYVKPAKLISTLDDVEVSQAMRHIRSQSGLITGETGKNTKLRETFAETMEEFAEEIVSSAVQNLSTINGLENISYIIPLLTSTNIKRRGALKFDSKTQKLHYSAKKAGDFVSIVENSGLSGFTVEKVNNETGVVTVQITENNESHLLDVYPENFRGNLNKTETGLAINSEIDVQEETSIGEGGTETDIGAEIEGEQISELEGEIDFNGLVQNLENNDRDLRGEIISESKTEIEADNEQAEISLPDKAEDSWSKFAKSLNEEQRKVQAEAELTQDYLSKFRSFLTKEQDKVQTEAELRQELSELLSESERVFVRDKLRQKTFESLKTKINETGSVLAIDAFRNSEFVYARNFTKMQLMANFVLDSYNNGDLRTLELLVKFPALFEADINFLNEISHYLENKDMTFLAFSDVLEKSVNISKRIENNNLSTFKAVFDNLSNLYQIKGINAVNDMYLHFDYLVSNNQNLEEIIDFYLEKGKNSLDLMIFTSKNFDISFSKLKESKEYFAVLEKAVSQSNESVFLYCLEFKNLISNDFTNLSNVFDNLLNISKNSEFELSLFVLQNKLISTLDDFSQNVEIFLDNHFSIILNEQGFEYEKLKAGFVYSMSLTGQNYFQIGNELYQVLMVDKSLHIIPVKNSFVFNQSFQLSEDGQKTIAVKNLGTNMDISRNDIFNRDNNLSAVASEVTLSSRELGHFDVEVLKEDNKVELKYTPSGTSEVHNTTLLVGEKQYVSLGLGELYLVSYDGRSVSFDSVVSEHIPNITSNFSGMDFPFTIENNEFRFELSKKNGGEILFEARAGSDLNFALVTDEKHKKFNSPIPSSDVLRADNSFFNFEEEKYSGDFLTPNTPQNFEIEDGETLFLTLGDWNTDKVYYLKREGDEIKLLRDFRGKKTEMVSVKKNESINLSDFLTEEKFEDASLIINGKGSSFDLIFKTDFEIKPNTKTIRESLITDYYWKSIRVFSSLSSVGVIKLANLQLESFLGPRILDKSSHNEPLFNNKANIISLRNNSQIYLSLTDFEVLDNLKIYLEQDQLIITSLKTNRKIFLNKENTEYVYEFDNGDKIVINYLYGKSAISVFTDRQGEDPLRAGIDLLALKNLKEKRISHNAEISSILEILSEIQEDKKSVLTDLDSTNAGVVQNSVSIASSEADITKVGGVQNSVSTASRNLDVTKVGGKEYQLSTAFSESKNGDLSENINTSEGAYEVEESFSDFVLRKALDIDFSDEKTRSIVDEFFNEKIGENSQISENFPSISPVDSLRESASRSFEDKTLRLVDLELEAMQSQIALGFSDTRVNNNFELNGDLVPFDFDFPIDFEVNHELKTVIEIGDEVVEMSLSSNKSYLIIQSSNGDNLFIKQGSAYSSKLGLSINYAKDGYVSLSLNKGVSALFSQYALKKSVDYSYEGVSFVLDENGNIMIENPNINPQNITPQRLEVLKRARILEEKRAETRLKLHEDLDFIEKQKNVFNQYLALENFSINTKENIGFSKRAKFEINDGILEIKFGRKNALYMKKAPNGNFLIINLPDGRKITLKKGEKMAFGSANDGGTPLVKFFKVGEKSDGVSGVHFEIEFDNASNVFTNVFSRNGIATNLRVQDFGDLKRKFINIEIITGKSDRIVDSTNDLEFRSSKSERVSDSNVPAQRQNFRSVDSVVDMSPVQNLDALSFAKSLSFLQNQSFEQSSRIIETLVKMSDSQIDILLNENLESEEVLKLFDFDIQNNETSIRFIENYLLSIKAIRQIKNDSAKQKRLKISALSQTLSLDSMNDAKNNRDLKEFIEKTKIVFGVEGNPYHVFLIVEDEAFNTFFSSNNSVKAFNLSISFEDLPAGSISVLRNSAYDGTENSVYLMQHEAHHGLEKLIGGARERLIALDRKAEAEYLRAMEMSENDSNYFDLFSSYLNNVFKLKRVENQSEISAMLSENLDPNEILQLLSGKYLTYLNEARSRIDLVSDPIVRTTLIRVYENLYLSFLSDLSIDLGNAVEILKTTGNIFDLMITPIEEWSEYLTFLNAKYRQDIEARSYFEKMYQEDVLLNERFREEWADLRELDLKERFRQEWDSFRTEFNLKENFQEDWNNFRAEFDPITFEKAQIHTNTLISIFNGKYNTLKILIENTNNFSDKNEYEVFIQALRNEIAEMDNILKSLSNTEDAMIVLGFDKAPLLEKFVEIQEKLSEYDLRLKDYFYTLDENIEKDLSVEEEISIVDLSSLKTKFDSFINDPKILFTETEKRKIQELSQMLNVENPSFDSLIIFENTISYFNNRFLSNPKFRVINLVLNNLKQKYYPSNLAYNERSSFSLIDSDGVFASKIQYLNSLSKHLKTDNKLGYDHEYSMEEGVLYYDIGLESLNFKFFNGEKYLIMRSPATLYSFESFLEIYLDSLSKNTAIKPEDKILLVKKLKSYKRLHTKDSISDMLLDLSNYFDGNSLGQVNFHLFANQLASFIDKAPSQFLIVGDNFTRVLNSGENLTLLARDLVTNSPLDALKISISSDNRVELTFVSDATQSNHLLIETNKKKDILNQASRVNENSNTDKAKLKFFADKMAEMWAVSMDSLGGSKNSFLQDAKVLIEKICINLQNAKKIPHKILNYFENFLSLNSNLFSVESYSNFLKNLFNNLELHISSIPLEKVNGRDVLKVGKRYEYQIGSSSMIIKANGVAIASVLLTENNTVVLTRLNSLEMTNFIPEGKSSFLLAGGLGVSDFSEVIYFKNNGNANVEFSLLSNNLEEGESYVDFEFSINEEEGFKVDNRAIALFEVFSDRIKFMESSSFTNGDKYSAIIEQAILYPETFNIKENEIDLLKEYLLKIQEIEQRVGLYLDELAQKGEVLLTSIQNVLEENFPSRNFETLVRRRKDDVRSLQKVFSEASGNIAEIKDVVGMMISVDNFTEMQNLKSVLMNLSGLSGVSKVRIVKDIPVNLLIDSENAGFNQFVLHVITDDGRRIEIQVHMKEVFDYYNEGIEVSKEELLNFGLSEDEIAILDPSSSLKSSDILNINGHRVYEIIRSSNNSVLINKFENLNRILTASAYNSFVLNEISKVKNDNNSK